MKPHNKLLIALLSITTLLMTTSVWAADTTPPPAKPAASAQQTAVNKDLGLLSKDGATGMQHVAQARFAIFEGRTDDAKKLVKLADSEFTKAKSDETAFTKAESELKAPPDKTASADPKTTGSVAPVDAAKTSEATEYGKADVTVNGVAPATPPSTTPVAWLPVDRSVSIAEDFTANPTKTKAVADASASLKSGDSSGAIAKLKLAAVKIDITVAAVPLLQTIDQVHQAAGMIDSGKYYEGSQELRLAQASVRFDELSNDATAPQ